VVAAELLRGFGERPVGGQRRARELKPSSRCGWP
jgi:hypothetical protein